jgi:arginyl-tRNA synthetase
MQIVKQELKEALISVVESLAPGAGARAEFETPKVPEHGDLAVTVAMSLAKQLKKNPRELAETLKQGLEAQPAFKLWVDAMEIAGPGFLNLRLKQIARHQVIKEVLEQTSSYGSKAKNGQKVLVEFVSANPTGPLHVGHGRQAALGDAICNLFETQGWQVHREFYYNDAGVQINTLALSTQMRARGLKPGGAQWPSGENAAVYNGEYIADIAKDFLAKKTVISDDRTFTASGDLEDLESIREFAVAYLRREQDLDLKAFAVHFDEYYLESSLYTTGRVKDAVQSMIASGHTYEADGALWLRSTSFKDDKDRVMRKSDATFTYFVPDVAYHLSKWERGYQKVINIQGTDHHGTIARVRAGLQAASEDQKLGIPAGYPDYVLHTMVRVMRGGVEVKISKRAGSYVTLRDLVEWTSKDAVRFFLLSRKPDTEYVFDVDLALAQNNDNPVFYVQYAHARICSVLLKELLSSTELDLDEKDRMEKVQEITRSLLHVNLEPLDSVAAKTLTSQLARYPDVLSASSENFAPHDISFYLRDLAGAYHSYYDAERILVEDVNVKNARLALVAATAQVIRNGLSVLGVGAPTQM